MDIVAQMDTALASLRELLGDEPFPRLGLILGSGLGSFVDELSETRSLAYAEIPGFPRSTVKGHAGRLAFGKVGAVPVVVMQGRFHIYEGYEPSAVVFPVRVLIRGGVESFIITNAAGGVQASFAAGDLMLITDHLNFSGKNALTGPHDEALGPRFPDMSEAYARPLQVLAREVALAEGLTLREGIYAVLGGPSYETPAEVRALEKLGADAVGMSTVYEVTACRQMGAEVLGLSLISNLAAGISPSPLSHGEVVEAGREASGRFVSLIRGIVSALPALRADNDTLET